MPAHPFKTNFTKGELTPKLIGRVDLQGYANGAECLENYVVQVHGGVARRAGTLFVYPAKDQTTAVRLMPFEFSVTQAYMLEFGAGYIRVFANRAPVLAATAQPATGITLGALTGCTVTITAATGTVFAAADVHREIRAVADGGRAHIRSVTDATRVTADVLVDFASLSLASASWFLSGAPVEVTSPYAATDLFNLRGAQSADVLFLADQHAAPRKLLRNTPTSFALNTISFNPPPSVELGIAPIASLIPAATSGATVNFNTDAGDAFLAADVDRQIVSGSARAVIIAIASVRQATGRVLDPFASTVTISSGAWRIDGSPVATLTVDKKEPVNAAVTLTLSLAGWRSTDVGKFIHVLGGLIQITQVDSTTAALGVLLSALTSTTPAPGGSWTLENEAWTVARGFPGVTTFHQQRLLWAGSPAQPDTVWGSVVADYENHSSGTDDDLAIEFTIADNGVNVIRWMVGADDLMLGTLSGAYRIVTPSDEPLTPTNINVKPASKYGADFSVDALSVGGNVLFLQRGQRQLREMVFSFETDGFLAPDVAILAEHLLREGVTQMAYLSAPDSVVLAVTGDGRLLTLAYERPEEVVGWSHHITAGAFESVAVLPNPCGTSEEVWVAVRRTIAGATVRYLEVFDGAVNTDAALVYAGTGVNALRGLTHLAGATVTVIADATRIADATIATCSLTLDATASAVEVGLPFTAHLKTMRLELPTPQGSVAGRPIRWSEILARVYCTTGPFLINGERIVTATTNFTGDVRKRNLGWDEGQISISASEPRPNTILAITGSVDVGDP
jgi:hypothetical protein